MFRESASWYDAVYGTKDYGAEADRVLAQATKSLGRRPQSVLDVGCGTGRHLERWRAEGLEVAGIDLDPGLLAVAQRRLPGVELRQADMEEFELGRRFDLVTNLFSSIGYMVTDDRLHRAVAAMARHLAPGGVLVVEPWITPDAWNDDAGPAVEQFEADGWTVVRLSVNHRDDRVTRLVMHHLVTDGREVRHLVDEHVLGLFTFAEYEDAFRAANLTDVHVDATGITGRGLVIGRAP